MMPQNEGRGNFMLKWVRRIDQLPFSRLMTIYEEGNREKAREEFSHLPTDAALEAAEQEFYQYLRQVFFKTPGAAYALWEEDGAIVSALRLEPYRDGLLLAALETASAHRRKGYGEHLVRGVLEALPNEKIYSHVSKSNRPSLSLHEKCGFRCISESAVYLDGSVSSRSCTFCRKPQ